MNRNACALILLLTYTTAAYGHPPHFRALISDRDLPNGSRIMGFTLNISGGRIGSLIEVPPGWQFAIDNDPSWSSTISGHAIVGAASLPQRYLAKLFTVEPPPPAVLHDLHSKLTASGTVTFLQSGRLLTKTIGRVTFDPVPTKSR